MIYARAQAIYDDYAGEMTSEIKQWRRYWKRCRYLVKIVETEKLAMEPEAGERVTYDGVVGKITEWLVRGTTHPNRTLAMGAALATAGTLKDRDWAMLAVQQFLEREKAKGS
jgi:hypothetical protein